MNKFTRITLLVVAVMAGAGILLCGISSLMGGGYRTIRRMAENGEFFDGDWNISGKDHGWFWSDGWFWDDGWFWEDDEESGTSTSYTYDAAQIKELRLDIDMAELEIVEGDAPDQILVKLYKCKEKYFTGETDGDALELTYDRKNDTHRNSHEKITVTLPKEMYLEELFVDAGATNTRIRHKTLCCDTVRIDIGAGNVEVDGFTVTGTLDVEAGAGNVEIYGGEYQNIEMDCSLGNFEMEGRVNGNLEADCSMGNMVLVLIGKESDYNYDLSCSLGNMEINGNTYAMIDGSRRETNEGAVGTIRLECDMGNMELEFVPE